MSRRRHGHSPRKKQSPEYRCWASMIQRTTNPQSPDWADYGGRGIQVCQKWRMSFMQFLLDVGRRPSPRHSIGRINNDGPYAPLNVRWETVKQQSLNRRSNTHLTLNSETMTLGEWAERLGVSRQVIQARLKRGWSVEKTLTTPLQK